MAVMTEYAKTMIIATFVIFLVDQFAYACSPPPCFGKFTVSPPPSSEDNTYYESVGSIMPNLTCHVTCNPQCTSIYWEKGRGSKEHVLTNTPVLSLGKLTSDDGDIYWCSAALMHMGGVMSSAVGVYISFGSPPSSVGVIVGSVIGVALVGAAVGAAIYWFVFRPRRQHKHIGHI